MLAFTADFRRLILAFHKFKSIVTGAKTGAWENSSERPCVKAGLRFCRVVFKTGPFCSEQNRADYFGRLEKRRTGF